MKTLTLLLTAVLAMAPGGDREKGLQLYRDGRFHEAAAAFEAAIRSEGDSAELQYNLALARWRAGDLPLAETAVEKYVAMAGDARTDLHAGVLGAVRFDEAKALEAKADALIAGAGAPPAQVPQPPQPVPTAPTAPAQPEDPLPLLEQAVQKATQAKDHFVRGAVAATSPELLRNTERTLRYLDELQKKIDELEKQREEQKKDDQKSDDKKDDEKKPEDEKGEKKDDKDGKQDDKKQDEKKPDEKQEGKPDDKPKEGEGEAKPEPKPGEPEPEPKQQDQPGQPQDGKPEEQKPPEPKPGEQPQDAKPEASKPRHDAPGEVEQGKELSPEQAQRVFDELQKLDEQLKAYRARAKSGRRPVERDW